MKKITVLVLMILMIITASTITTYASSTDIIGPDVIHKQSNHILTISDIVSLYSSSHGTIGVAQDNYTGYGNVLGDHTLDLYVSDGTDVYTKQVIISVVSTLGNVKAVTDFKDIHLRTDQVLTSSEIVYVLEKTGYVQITATTQMLILTDTYSANKTDPGQYTFEFRLVNSAGLDQIYTSFIYVSDETNLFIPDIVFEAPPSAFSSIWNVVVSIFYLAVFVGVGYVIYKVVSKPRKKV